MDGYSLVFSSVLLVIANIELSSLRLVPPFGGKIMD